MNHKQLYPGWRDVTEVLSINLLISTCGIAHR